ncbi:hypothetical protein SAMN05661093_04658 [Kibdelosporangium aridum]|uniref:Uncharacterized protein n=1 Tax=Kibdelosporangium aridum TaxID=2030 RepID=A0A1W2ELN3_KIBAR|nr:hypothetical protein SAMN05661093_04658 [Kibdelosporangium aridum]
MAVRRNRGGLVQPRQSRATLAVLCNKGGPVQPWWPGAAKAVPYNQRCPGTASAGAA